MTTTEINAARNELIGTAAATVLVVAIRNMLRTKEMHRPRRQMVALVTNGATGSAIVASADFAEAVTEVDARLTTPVWLDHDVIDDEKIGEDVSRYPFLY